MLKVNLLFTSFICYLFFSLVLLNSCSGQEKPKPIKDSQFKTFPIPFQESQKLKLDPSAQIGGYFPDIFQDRKGNFWFATAFSGLSKFDGDTLTKFTIPDGLPHNTILDLTEDKEGNVWVATRNGVSKHDGKSFINFTEVDGLASNWTTSILSDSKGNIWVGTKEGVSIYNGKSFSPFNLPKPDNINIEISANHVIRIIEDKKGNIWFGRIGYGVSKFDGKSFTHFTKEDGLYSNSIKSILEDKKGNMWFGALETEIDKGGLSYYDGNIFTTFPEIEGLSGHEIWDICEDNYGNIWFAPKNRGIFLYDGNKFTQVQGSMDLTPYSCVQNILEDNEGRMWFGYSDGVFRLNGNTFINITNKGPWK